MISVIICSANPGLLDKIRININETIGVPYEVLAYSNSDAKRSICEIYNLGVVTARYNILCFVHEDVEFNSLGWGEEVIIAFNNNERLGLLGVAGSSYKSLSPSGWQASEVPERINYINLKQRYKFTPKAEEIKYVNTLSLSLANVAVIDGVWFCGRKDILEKYPFDQQTLQKFHGYDIDISLSVGTYFDVNITFKVMLTHFSEGYFGKDWIEATLLLNEKWRPSLPVNKAFLSETEMKTCEKHAFKSFINTMRKAGYSSTSCLKVLNRSGIRSRFGTLLYLSLAIKCLTAKSSTQKLRLP